MQKTINLLLKRRKGIKRPAPKIEKKNQNFAEELHLELSIGKNEPDLLIKLKELFYDYPGKSQVVLHFKDKDKTILHAIDKKYSVNIDDKFMEEIRGILRDEKIWTENLQFIRNK